MVRKDQAVPAEDSADQVAETEAAEAETEAVEAVVLQCKDVSVKSRYRNVS